MKQFSPKKARISHHERVLKRVLAKIQVEETLRRGEDAPSDVFLIGMPGYEIMMNDQAFDQNKKNITLT